MALYYPYHYSNPPVFDPTAVSGCCGLPSFLTLNPLYGIKNTQGFGLSQRASNQSYNYFHAPPAMVSRSPQDPSLQQPDEEQVQTSQQLTASSQLDHPSVDPSLSSIAAFNAAYNSSHSSHETNEWGKRPSVHELPNDVSGLTAGDPAAKRQHLDTQHLEGVVAGVDNHGMQNEVVDSHVSAMGDVSAVFANRASQPSTDGQYDHHHHHHHQGHHEHSQGNGLESAIDGEDEDGMDQEFEMDDDEHEHCASTVNPWNFMDQNYMLWDANQNLRVQSLPILDNLSTQILTTLGKGPYQETLNIVTQPDSDQGQAYNTMKSLFDQTKKLYTPEAFLSADELKLDLPEQRATVRKVNLATFVSSVFGSQEVGFFHLNEHFLDTFVPDGGRLLKSQGALYLDLKTQAYISAMSTNERGKEEILTDLFPDDMKEILLNRRPGAKSLTPSETDFVLRLGQRKTHLMMIVDDTNLSEKYVWQDFLKEVSWYVSKNYETIVTAPMRRIRKRKSSNAVQRVHTPPGDHRRSPSLNHSQLVTPTHAHTESIDTTTVAVLAAHSVAHAVSQPSNTAESVTPAQVALEAELFGSNTSIAMSLGAPPAQNPIPQQSAPTQVLYERARLAATAKASPNARRAGLPSQRRPWSTEEENALMAGLDRVKGPHWSQILAMFGPGGTVNETLKDRNQVQLKDKARNLKLFFLKSGIEVPYYLQFVTGELKTRAPGQAAKNAAKKAVEASADEDAAHVAAITALGNVRGMSGQDIQRMDSQDLGINMMDEPESQSPSHSPAAVAPTADMGMGMENVLPVFEALQQHQQQEQQQQHVEQSQEQEQDPLKSLYTEQPAPNAPPMEERVDPGLMGVDPSLRGGVGHEVSAERATA